MALRHQFQDEPEGIRPERDRIAIEVLQIVGEGVLAALLGLRPLGLAVFQPADQEGQNPAGVGEADLQVRKAIQDTPEDQVGRSDGRLQGKPQEIGQVIIADPLDLPRDCWGG